MSERIRRQIVGSVVRSIPVQVDGSVCATINRITGVPVRGGCDPYRIEATAPLECDRATSQVHLLRAGPISGHCNRLAAQIKVGITARKIIERDALKPREGSQLIDPERAAAIER